MKTRSTDSLRAILAGSLLFGGTIVASVATGTLPAGAVTPVTLYVAAGGSGSRDCSSVANACSSVQTAIDTAEGSAYAGDDVSVNVAAGQYTERVTIAASSLHSLALVGAGQSTTTVSGGGTGSVFTVSTTGTISISGFTIQDGAAYDGGGIANSSGASVSVADSTFYDDAAWDGAAIDNADNGGTGTLSVTRSTFSTNNGADGAAIDNADNGGSGTLSVTDSTFSQNFGSGTGQGGAIDNGDNGGTGTLSVTNSTFSQNYAQTGGAILSHQGTASVTESTFSGNTATVGGHSLQNVGPGTLTVAASVLADMLSGPECTGTITDGGYNIEDDAPAYSCGFSGTSASGGGLNLDNSLGSLADNGGPTQTILPGAGSPVIGVIPSGTTLNGIPVCPRLDQRGAASQGSCAVGAVEPVVPAFYFSTAPLPHATPGSAYGPVTLTVEGVAVGATVKWKKISLPKGLKLTPTGVLSGTPNKNLAAGANSIAVAVTETVTTLKGKKKVKTLTTIDATIPLVIA